MNDKMRALLEKENETLNGMESEAEWITRLKTFGVTDEQIDAFIEVRSLEAFVKYCREQGIELADISKTRLTSNSA